MAAPRRGTFAFDLSKPLKRGSLLKQGAFHKAFKTREFILYPGFLVYYDNENRWRLDLTKGETLGGRLGAVKLKGATVSIARNAPRACKYGLMLTAPDPANKRKAYLMNGSSKEERDSWIEAIRKATPNTPRVHRKDVKARDKDSLPRPDKSSHRKSSPSEKDLAPPHPQSTARQDTAVEAAVAVADSTDQKEEQEAIDRMITDVNSSLKAAELGAMERHNTATLAAITLASDAADTPQENGIEEEDVETSIDMILGNRDEDDSSSAFSGTPEAPSPTPKSPEPDSASQEQEQPEAASQEQEAVLEAESEEKEAEQVAPEVVLSLEPEEEEIVLKQVTQDVAADPDPEAIARATVGEKFLSPEPVTPAMTPAPEEATEMDTEESVKSNKNGDTGTTTVMTTVTVACSSQGGSPILERKEEGEEEASAAVVNGKEGKEDEEEEEEINDEKRGRSTSSTQILVSNNENTTLSVNLNGYDTDNTLSDEESHDDLPELVQNGLKEESKGSPVIKVKEDRTGSGSSHGSSHDSDSSTEAGKLAAPANQRRRSSTPFIEKKGYLYKMGGQRKTWKLRYFVLRPGVFQYFKDTRLIKPIGEVKLKNLSIFFPGLGERKQSFQFTVHTESSWNKRADWVFAGQSEREMKEWITAFKLAGGMKVGSLEPDDIIDDD